MPVDSLKKVDQVIESDTILQKQPPLYPNAHDIYSLKVDDTLPLIKFKNIPDTLKTTNEKISFSVIVPSNAENVDLFLLINKIKKDMYYQAEPGEYHFNNVLLEPGENLIEIFYRVDHRKSASIYSVIIKEN